MDRHEKYDLIYAAVASIPRGRVASYGQVAALAGLPRNARMVGYALRELPAGSDLPWYRVVNHQGGVSPRGAPESERDQRELLEAEGVVFERGRVAMKRFQWDTGDRLVEEL